MADTQTATCNATAVINALSPEENDGEGSYEEGSYEDGDSYSEYTFDCLSTIWEESIQDLMNEYSPNRRGLDFHDPLLGEITSQQLQTFRLQSPRYSSDPEKVAHLSPNAYNESDTSSYRASSPFSVREGFLEEFDAPTCSLDSKCVTGSNLTDSTASIHTYDYYDEHGDESVTIESRTAHGLEGDERLDNKQLDLHFVAYSSGPQAPDDSHSLISDLDSGHLGMRYTHYDDEAEDSSLEQSPLVSSRRRRRVSISSTETLDSLFVDTATMRSDDERGICMRSLAFEQARRKLEREIAQFLVTCRETKEESLYPSPSVRHGRKRPSVGQNISPNDASELRRLDLVRRLRLERYGGLRRSRFYKRSKRSLERKIGKTLRHRELAENTASLPGNREPQQVLLEKIDHFGGRSRRVMFEEAKEQFERRFDKEVKPFVSPLRHRRSLSPINRKAPLERSNFFLRMSKSDSNLMSTASREKVFLKNEDDDELVLDPNFERKHKHRQERFGGLRRRTSFKRSQRVLSRKFEEIQSRSKEERERLVGLHRMDSYKQSRKLFQPPESKTEFAGHMSNLEFSFSAFDPSVNGGEVVRDAPCRHLSEKSEENGKGQSSYCGSQMSLGDGKSDKFKLSRSRIRRQMAKQRLEDAFREYQLAIADCDKQSLNVSFTSLLQTLSDPQKSTR